MGPKIVLAPLEKQGQRPNERTRLYSVIEQESSFRVEDTGEDSVTLELTVARLCIMYSQNNYS